MKTLFVIAALMCSVVGFAGATASQQPSFTPPNSNPVFQSALTFYGATVYRVETAVSSNTPVSLFSGSGYLYGISCSAGSSGDFGLAFDAASASGITVNTVNESASPAVLSSANGATTCTAAGICGQWKAPSGGVRIHNGLVALKSGLNTSGGSETCYFYALPDSVIQAVPQTH